MTTGTENLSATMRRALLRFAPSAADPEMPQGVREGTREALSKRGLVEAVQMRSRYANHSFYRYRRTPAGDQVAAEQSIERATDRLAHDLDKIYDVLP